MKQLQSINDKSSAVGFLVRRAEPMFLAIFGILGLYARGILGFIDPMVKLSKNGLNPAEIANVVWGNEGVFTSLFTDIYPPLFPILIKPFLGLGVELGPRLVSAIAGMAFCFVMWWLARRAYGAWVGALTFYFCILSPQLIRISRVALSFQLFALFAALALWGYVRLKDSPSKKRMIGFALILTAGLYTFYYMIFIVLFFICLGLISWFKERDLSKRVLTAGGLSLVLFIPMIVILAMQWERIAFLPHVPVWDIGAWRLVRSVFSSFLRASPAVGFTLVGRLLPVISSIILILVGGSLILFGILGARRRMKNEPSVWLLVSFFLFGSIVPILAHWIFRIPAADHYRVFLMVATIPLVANACLWSKKKFVVLIFIVLLTLSNVMALRMIPNQFDNEIRDGIRWVDQTALDANALVATIDFGLVDAYRVYGRRDLKTVGLPAGLSGHGKMYPEQVARIRPKDKAGFEALIANHDEVFLIVGDAKSGQVDRGRGLVNHWFPQSGFSLKGLAPFNGGNISRFVRVKPADQMNTESGQ